MSKRASERKTIVHFARSSWIQGDTPKKKVWCVNAVFFHSRRLVLLLSPLFPLSASLHFYLSFAVGFVVYEIKCIAFVFSLFNGWYTKARTHTHTHTRIIVAADSENEIFILNLGYLKHIWSTHIICYMVSATKRRRVI